MIERVALYSMAQMRMQTKAGFRRLSENEVYPWNNVVEQGKRKVAVISITGLPWTTGIVNPLSSAKVGKNIMKGYDKGYPVAGYE
ncbi:hypothetical protein SUGI_1151460 [Cryptomeria japonica]|nr:hypothetical protein SUGI_1151460 [Cryptomeria japonica]